MLKLFKDLLSTSMLASVMFIFLGLAFIIFPAGSLALISNLIAIMLIAYGIYGLFLSFQRISVSYSLNIGSSIISLVLGLVVLCNNAILEAIIPIILGLFFIINGTTKLRYSLVLKAKKRDFLAPMTIAIVLLACGVVMLIHPVFSAVALTTFLGIVMLIYAICDLVDAAFLRRDISAIESYFDKSGKKIREAEVVDKKHKK